MRSRPGVGCLGVSRPAHASKCATCAGCARDRSAARAAGPMTWALRAQCARGLGFGCEHCTPNPVLIQCTVYSHCLETVHENCSEGKKIKKIQKF